MNYTKTIRQFCAMNPDSLFDVSYMATDYFSMIPYKTLLRILNRLEEEEILLPVSKGVYYIKGEKEYNLDEAIKQYYVDKGCGMFVGYRMYNELKVSDHSDDTVEIYTSRIGTAHKNIGSYHLTKADLYYDYRIRNIIESLELIQNGNSIREIDYVQYSMLRADGVTVQSDECILSVIEAIPYQYTTLVTYDMILQSKGYTGRFLEEFKEKHSNDAFLLLS